MKVIRKLLSIIHFYLYKIEWRKRNPHNFTTMKQIFPMDKIVVGNYTYGPLDIYSYNNPDESIQIGHFCSIAKDVVFITGGEHTYSTLSTYPFKNMLMGVTDFKLESKTKGPIIIEDDVWLGFGSMILSGVKVSKGAIIGAGSVVSHDIPPYAIYAGNRIIRYRFPDEIIERLLKIDYSKFTEEYIVNHIDNFCDEIGNDASSIAWMQNLSDQNS